MRRGPKPAKSKEATLPVTRRSPKDDGERVRDLEKRLAESLKRESVTGDLLQEKHRELTESWDQQKATSEILRVLGGSYSNVEPVFENTVAPRSSAPPLLLLSCCSMATH